MHGGGVINPHPLSKSPSPYECTWMKWRETTLPPLPSRVFQIYSKGASNANFNMV